MDWLSLTVLFPLLVGAVAIVVGVSNAAKRQNHRQLEIDRRHLWAQHHGLHYTPNDRDIAALSSRAPFGVGSNRIGHDVFRGTHRGRPLVFGEYHYTTENNDTTTLHRWQFVALAMPTSRPWLSIRRETGTGFLSRLGRKKLELESQEFNDRFRIDTASERFAYDVLNPRTMEWLLADIRANTVGFRFEGQWAITVRQGTLRPEEVRWYADFLADVIALVPDFVWRY